MDQLLNTGLESFGRNENVSKMDIDERRPVENLSMVDVDQ